MEVSADIKYIQTCKTERITSTFPKVNMSLKNTNFKLKWKSATLIIETEMQNKH